MIDYELSKHAKDMIFEREIKLDWLTDTINKPDKVITINVDEIHYIKRIVEFDNKSLRVVINPVSSLAIVVTLFFDRRIK